MLPVLAMAFGITAAALHHDVLQSLKQGAYASLFERPAHPQLAVQHPRVLCGMRLIPADPTIDPQIRIVAPSTPEHKIQAVRPPVCVD